MPFPGEVVVHSLQRMHQATTKCKFYIAVFYVKLAQAVLFLNHKIKVKGTAINELTLTVRACIATQGTLWFTRFIMDLRQSLGL